MTLKAGVRLLSLYVLGLLNSKLLDYYLHRTSSRFRGGYWAYSRQYIARLPIRVLDISKATEKRQHDALVALAEQMLKLQERLVAEGDIRDEDRIQLEREISRTERDIDELVYDLYGVTQDERRLVENEVSA